MVLIGDLVHVAAVQFANPETAMKFDSDAKAGEKQRRLAYAEFAKEGALIGAAHLAFPGLGHIRTGGKAFEFVPLNYNR